VEGEAFKVNNRFSSAKRSWMGWTTPCYAKVRGQELSYSSHVHPTLCFEFHCPTFCDYMPSLWSGVDLPRTTQRYFSFYL